MFSTHLKIAKFSLIYLSALTILLPTSEAQRVNTNAITTQSSRVVSDLLNLSRPAVLARFKEFQSLEAKRPEIQATSSRLLSSQQESKRGHELTTNALNSALDAQYAAQTRAEIVPEISGLHQALLSQVQIFRDQVVFQGPRFIGGDVYKNRRPAMAKIIASEASYLRRVAAIEAQLTTFINSLANEMRVLSTNINAAPARFGVDHYVNLTLSKLAAYKVALDRVSALFNGLDTNLTPRTPFRACSDDRSSFSTFDQELDVIEINSSTLPYQSTNPAQITWPKWVQDRVLANIYNGNPASGLPGFISDWGGCIGSKQRNMQTLFNDIERESKRGNIDLAKQLELQRSDLEVQVIVFSMERDSIIDRRDRVLEVLASAAQQASTENLASEPNAWRRTVGAHVADLKSVSLLFPSVLRAGVDLLKRVEAQVEAVATITDPKELASKFALAARNIDSIRIHGLSRLSDQLDSADDNLVSMSRSIASGEGPLEESLLNYELATQTKVTFWAAEQASMSGKLFELQSKVFDAQKGFDQSFALLRDIELKVDQLKILQTKYEERISRFNKVLSVAKFNPIYSSLVQQLFLPVANDAGFVKAKISIENESRRVLSQFNGVLLVSVKVAALKSSSNPTVKKLIASRNLLSRSIQPAIDSAAAPLLGESITEFLKGLQLVVGELGRL